MRVEDRVGKAERPKLPHSGKEEIYIVARFLFYMLMFALALKRGEFLFAVFVIAVYFDFFTVGWRFKKVKNIVGEFSKTVAMLVGHVGELREKVGMND